LFYFNIKPYHAWCTFNRPIVPKQHYYVRRRKKSNIMSEFSLKMLKHINICHCSLDKIWISRTNCSARKFGLTINFDLMINFDFFWPNNVGIVHGTSVKFGLWTFNKLKRQKNFDFIDFWLPYSYINRTSGVDRYVNKTIGQLIKVEYHADLQKLSIWIMKIRHRKCRFELSTYSEKQTHSYKPA